MTTGVSGVMRTAAVPARQSPGSAWGRAVRRATRRSLTVYFYARILPVILASGYPFGTNLENPP
jgi:hypothetical protein